MTTEIQKGKDMPEPGNIQIDWGDDKKSEFYRKPTEPTQSESSAPKPVEQPLTMLEYQGLGLKDVSTAKMGRPDRSDYFLPSPGECKAAGVTRKYYGDEFSTHGSYLIFDDDGRAYVTHKMTEKLSKFLEENGFKELHGVPEQLRDRWTGMPQEGDIKLV